MSGVDGKTLQLNLENNCQGGTCRCNQGSNKPDDITTSRDTSFDQVKGFVRYTHRSNDPFTLSQNLGGDEKLQRDISNVKSVAIYYWDKDTNYKKPLLLEVETSDGPKQYYYRYEQDECEAQNDTSTWKYNPGNHKLQDRLDDRNCGRNHAVPFDIKEPTKDYSPGVNSTCLKTKRKIEVDGGSKNLPGSEYVTTTYKVNGNDTKISRAVFGSESTNISLPENYPVSNVRVYSQKNAASDQVPLMLQFIKNGGSSSKWFYSKDKSGTIWGTIGSTDNFYKDNQPTEKLTTALDDVRCVRDSEVTIDISYKTSTGGPKYCCTYHTKGSDKGKVAVTPAPVSCKVKGHTSTPITAYRHSIESNMKLAGIKYYPDGDVNEKDRKRIKSTKLSFPISAPVTISAFYCNENGNGPVLIYVDSKGNAAKGWFKKGGTQDSEDWTPVPSNLDSITPDNFSTLNCEQWNQLREVLTSFGCNDFKECPTDNSSLLKKILGGGGGTVASGATVGGVGYGGWYTYNNYFLDALVRLI